MNDTALSALLRLMERLRDPERGCPWDREQTFATIAPYTIEEAYEVADAAERGDPAQLRDELGDLLFQVVFHARMAEERGWFDFAAVARAIHDKLVRRHPHVFVPDEASTGGSKNAAELSRSWEELKARERAENGEASALAGIPKALPALTRAAKLGRRAARVGFDWPDARQVRAKVLEELAEVDAALEAARETNSPAEVAISSSSFGAPPPSPSLGARRVVDEVGDLLFAVVNWSRHLKLDPEEALRAANAKFEQRFRRMESLAATRGLALEALSAAEWDALWCQVKLHG